MKKFLCIIPGIFLLFSSCKKEEPILGQFMLQRNAVEVALNQTDLQNNLVNQKGVSSFTRVVGGENKESLLVNMALGVPGEQARPR